MMRSVDDHPRLGLLSPSELWRYWFNNRGHFACKKSTAM